MRQILFLLPLAALLAACGGNDDLPPMVGSGATDNTRAEALYQQAKTAEDAGKTKKAIKLYEELADEIAYSDRAAEARFRQAQLLEQQGETLDAFDAYQKLIAQRTGSGYYKQAFDRQSALAFSAADGDISDSFFGIKSGLAANKVIGMLQKVADNAPRSPVAAEADYRIGEIHVRDGKVNEAVVAFREVVENYPTSPQAPEAQFRIGEILLEEANEGNQDQANLNRAKEALQDYLSQFPGHKRNAEARRMISNIGGRDLQNSYDIGVFYEKKGEYSSARYYYEEVIRRTKSGELHDKAQARLNALNSN
ncbi:tetratricopeptide repeat protein [Haloferula sp. A504]|uniref:tetratricopeptide repeat protein n=1 Tax=Haloferula sp. A504 TaxID=3373601 RepID=UPI0031C3BBF9|nr:tetratricopeptide repeat protein [Verrucomicrobiaceae bacterium E54]